MFGSQKSIYQNGFGINAGYMWRLSPSFNLGPDLSVNSISTRSGQGDLQMFSVRAQLIWFPARLIQSISKKESLVLKGFYFDTAIGHNFKDNNVFDDIVLNTSHIGVGYMFPQHALPIYLNLGVTNFMLKSYFTDEQKINNDIFTVTAGVHF
ncbi:hypothetical protein BEL04_15165 [Mucilaginibacter sp. PPCGB 2223]|nr:hypothetical protein BEL04_15165 [Mucilaginibacter sp. PPCGB 2223]